MKAYIDQNWMHSGAVRIYVVQRAGPGLQRLWRSKGGDQWSFDEIKDGEKIEGATIEMPKEMLEAIVAASHDILPPSAATDRHLKDAIAVRDRLLTIVEKT